MWTKRFPLDGELIPTLFKENHTYADSSGKEYKSVSSILSTVKPKFDVEQRASEYALRKKISVDDVISLWDEKKNTGLDYGTEIHENVENFFINGKISNERYKDVVEEIYSKVYQKDGCNELICFDKKKGICGTADYVVFKEQTFDIFDFKTNKKFNFQNQYDDKYLLNPVSHLPNSEYFIYALQLSFYAKMIENLTGLNCRFLNIFWLKRQIDTKMIFKAKWLKYTVPYLESEVKDILYSV
jgi:uncharacterized protein YxjI